MGGISANTANPELLTAKKFGCVPIWKTTAERLRRCLTRLHAKLKARDFRYIFDLLVFLLVFRKTALRNILLIRCLLLVLDASSGTKSLIKDVHR